MVLPLRLVVSSPCRISRYPDRHTGRMCQPHRHTPCRSRCLRLTRRKLCQTLSAVEQADCAWYGNGDTPPVEYEIGEVDLQCEFARPADLDWSECSTDDECRSEASDHSDCRGSIAR